MEHKVVIPKSYSRLSGKELRHRAGLAWVRGQMGLAGALERMASQLVARVKPGEHGCVGIRSTTYPSVMAHRVATSRSSARVSYGF